MNTWSVNDLVAVVDAVDAAAIDALVAEHCERYDVAPELAPGGDRAKSLRYAAREEIALRAFLEERRGPVCSLGDVGIPASFLLVKDREGGWRSQLKGGSMQRVCARGRRRLSGLMRGVGPRCGGKFPLPKNVPVVVHLSTAELQPPGKCE